MSTIKTDIVIRKKYPPDIGISTTDSGSLPLGGYEGQVVTKVNKKAKWVDSPITVATESELPVSPSTHCFYYIEDANRLVRFNGQSWEQVNEKFAFAYDEEEEALYLNVVE